MLHRLRSSMRPLSNRCLGAWSAQPLTQLPLQSCLHIRWGGSAGLWRSISHSARAASAQAPQTHAASLARDTELLAAVSICSRNLGREPDEEVVALVSAPCTMSIGTSVHKCQRMQLFNSTVVQLQVERLRRNWFSTAGDLAAVSEVLYLNSCHTAARPLTVHLYCCWSCSQGRTLLTRHSGASHGSNQAAAMQRDAEALHVPSRLLAELRNLLEADAGLPHSNGAPASAATAKPARQQRRRTAPSASSGTVDQPAAPVSSVSASSPAARQGRQLNGAGSEPLTFGHSAAARTGTACSSEAVQSDEWSQMMASSIAKARERIWGSAAAQNGAAPAITAGPTAIEDVSSQPAESSMSEPGPELAGSNAAESSSAGGSEAEQPPQQRPGEHVVPVDIHVFTAA